METREKIKKIAFRIVCGGGATVKAVKAVKEKIRAATAKECSQNLEDMI